MSLQAVIFDLDDTLYDCNGSLVQRGHELAAAAMAAAGVPATAEEILASRLRLSRLGSAAGLDSQVLAELGGPAEAAEVGRAAYHRPDRIESIRPFPCTRAVLTRLAEAGLRLAMMTRGVEEIQRAKLAALGLAEFFEAALFVGLAQNKRDVLEAWLDDARLEAADVLVVGDRPDSEIEAGRQLGCRTVRLRHGEFAHLDAEGASQQADQTIGDLAELPATLGLASIEIKAPCRVDLGGGTLDIWPIHTLIGGGRTVNAAISLCQRVEIRPCLPGQPVLRVVSREREARLQLDSWDAPASGELALFAEAVRSLPPPFPCVVETHGAVPKGSGLGGSSALLIALLRGLLFVRNEAMSPQALVELVHNLEARAIGVPTGIQDYLAALGGGFRSVAFDDFGWRDVPCHPSAAFRARLDAALCLFYAGEPHFSAVPNWLMLRAAIDEAERCLPLFRKVSAAAELAWQALNSEDLAALARAFDLDWEGRRHLAEGVSTENLERQIAAARKAGALGIKVCGAGGGGTFLAVCERDTRAQVIASVRAVGGVHLPVRFGVPGATLRPLPVLLKEDTP